MEERKKRFSEAYEYVCSNTEFYTQTKVAEKMGASRSNVNRALHGDPKVLTDQFIRRFCRAFPQINAGWIIYGVGAMLTAATSPSVPPVSVTEQLALITMLLREMIAEMSATNQALLEAVRGAPLPFKKGIELSKVSPCAQKKNVTA